MLSEHERNVIIPWGSITIIANVNGLISKQSPMLTQADPKTTRSVFRLATAIRHHQQGETSNQRKNRPLQQAKSHLQTLSNPDEQTLCRIRTAKNKEIVFYPLSNMRLLCII